MNIKPLSIIIIAVILMSSLTLNIVLYHQAHKYFVEVNNIRLDPLGTELYETPDLPDSNIKKEITRVVFLGDSRALQWPVPAHLRELIFFNRGIAAQTSAQVLGRYDRHILPLRPDILVIQVCINDLKTIPLFKHLKQRIVDSCKANINEIVEKSINSGAKIILTTIFPLGDIPMRRRIFWSSEVESAIQDVNHYIASLKKANVRIYDAASILVDQNGSVRADYQADFLHINEKGYIALNKHLRNILLEMSRDKRYMEGARNVQVLKH
ncbi:MAG: GDSL-type esterase/lipase family protein [Gammaproteobacteria bacterium]|nr:GDSL-type esterase/lipase family protein [Gammaproteobacteria bacterium]